MLEDGPSVFARNGERNQREQEAQEVELYEQMAAARPLPIRTGCIRLDAPYLSRIVVQRSGITITNQVFQAACTELRGIVHFCAQGKVPMPIA